MSEISMESDIICDDEPSTSSAGSESSASSGTTSSVTKSSGIVSDSISSFNNSLSECTAALMASQTPVTAQPLATNSTVKRKFRSLTFGRRKKTLQCFANNKCKQQANNPTVNCCDNCKCSTNASSQRKKKHTSAMWVPFSRLCARTESCADVTQPSDTSNGESCVCTAYKKTGELSPQSALTIGSNMTTSSSSGSLNRDRLNQLHNISEIESNRASNGLNARDLPIIDEFSAANGSRNMDTYVETNPMAYAGLASGGASGGAAGGTYQLPVGVYGAAGGQRTTSEVRSSVQVKVSELALALRSQLALTVSPYPYLARWGEVAELTPGFLNRFCVKSDSSQALNPDNSCGAGQLIHTQIDYIHCLVPDLLEISKCGFYWGKMDRYEAERLLENKPEGTFLLRDSAQEEHLFSVSFRRFERSLHARIEQLHHRFSFDSHDPGVYSTDSVCGLLEHYKDPAHCMFFEPMLTIPLHRNFTFSLQHLCRSTITSRLTYDTIPALQLPKRLKNYLKEYHYKQQVRVRRLDGDH